MTTLRTRPILALLIAFLVLFALSSAVYALGKVLGYIPGVGLVDQSTPVRVLAEPVTDAVHGISVTISRVVADSARTFIAYRVDGIPLGANGFPTCAAIPEIHLADGARLEDQTGSGGIAGKQNGNTISFDEEHVFAAIPNGANDATFVLACLLPDGSPAVTVRLPLDLIPAPAGYATPAVEIVVTPDGEANTTGLHLQKVIELDNSYVLIGKFSDGGDLNGPLYMTTSSDSEYLPHIEDANGESVPFKVREDLRPDPDWDVAYYWAYEVAKPVAAPLTITVDQVNFRRNSTAQIQFEAGDHPQSGQEWKLDKKVKLGTYTFTLEKIKFIGNGYVLSWSNEQLPPNVSSYVSLVDNPSNPFQFDNQDESGTLVGNVLQNTLTLTTQSLPPTGTLTVEWHLEEAIPQPGPWPLVWSPSGTKP